MSQSYYVLKIQYSNKPEETRNVSQPTLTMGREAGDVVLGDEQTSGHHCDVTFANGVVSVTDVGSSNGTWFNGQRVQQFNLSPGEWFQIGRTTVQLLAIHGPPAASTPAGPAKTMLAFGGAPPPPAPGTPPPSGWAAVPAPAPPPQAPAPPPQVAAHVPQNPVPRPQPATPPPQSPAPQPQPAAAAPQAPAAQVPAPAPSAAAPHVPQPAQAMSLTQAVAPRYHGSGTELLVLVLIHGVILTTITFGIYAPWFLCKLQAAISAKTTIEGTARGSLQLAFDGRGGALFVQLLKYLLVPITLGIFLAWWIVGLIRFFTDATSATAADGTRYKLRFHGTGGELFVAIFVQMILVFVTFGIYAPWALCKIWQVLARQTQVEENGQAVGTVDFVGSGVDLFIQYLLLMVLMLPTLTLYQFWFQVKMMRFFARGTRVSVGGRTYAGDFTGAGGQWLLLNFLGLLLTILTLGIYYPWFIVKIIRFQYDHTSYREISGAQAALQPHP